MERGVKTFAEALWRKKAKTARKKFERIARRLGTEDEYWRGYSRALQGMVAALESGDDLTFLRQVIGGKYSSEDVRGYLDGFKTKASQDFRPRDERGYHAAWVEVLQVFLEMAGRSRENNFTGR